MTFRSGIISVFALALNLQLMSLCIAGDELSLAKDGKALAVIVGPKNPDRFEKLAVAELQAYLNKMTGASFSVESEESFTPREKGPTPIWVGQSKAADENGWNRSKLGDEEAVISIKKDQIILTGGARRGTISAAYRFLEDFTGVRWWTLLEETVPNSPDLKVKVGTFVWSPVFTHRYLTVGAYPEGLFSLRNRLTPYFDENGKYPGNIEGQMAFNWDLGYPAEHHSLARYLPTSLFKEKPSWFATINGSPTSEGHGLNLQNPEAREYVQKVLRGNIRIALATAREYGMPEPRIFTVSAPDNAPNSEDPLTQKVIKDNESEGASTFDFVNAAARSIQKDFPNIQLLTLAYQGARQVPKRIKMEKNVAVQYCTEELDMSVPLSSPNNEKTLAELQRWRSATDHLWIWEYNASFAYGYTYLDMYGGGSGFPIPNFRSIEERIRYYKSVGVEGVMLQFSGDASTSVYWDNEEMKHWISAKLLEDPEKKYDDLLHEFLNGYYGKASEKIGEYLALLDQQKSQVTFYSELSELSYLKLDFLKGASDIMDAAQAAAQGDPEIERRVQFFRMPLDRATLYLWPYLQREWKLRGMAADEFPFDKQKLLDRFQATVTAQVEFRSREEAKFGFNDARVVKLYEKERAVFETNRFLELPYPGELPKAEAQRVYDFDAKTANFRPTNAESAILVDDATASSGAAYKIPKSSVEATKASGGAQDNPIDFLIAKGASGGLTKTTDVFQWGLRHLFNGDQKPNEIKAKKNGSNGYHWYNLGRINSGGNSDIYFQNKALRFFLPMTGALDVWANIKVKGDGDDAFYIDRVILIKDE